jgi:hypothetical protein
MDGLNFSLRENPLKRNSFYIVLKNNRNGPDYQVAKRIGYTLEDYQRKLIEEYKATLTKSDLLQFGSREDAQEALDWMESQVVMSVLAGLE